MWEESCWNLDCTLADRRFLRIYSVHNMKASLSNSKILRKPIKSSVMKSFHIFKAGFIRNRRINLNRIWIAHCHIDGWPGSTRIRNLKIVDYPILNAILSDSKWNFNQECPLWKYFIRSIFYICLCPIPSCDFSSI